MDAIHLPDHEVAPMGHLAEGVSGLRIVFVNVFAIATSTGWTLIDAGLPLSESRIRNWAEAQFGKNAAPDAIVLTHCHFDHVGVLKSLAEKWDVPVYAHPMELPYIRGVAEYPPPDPTVGGGLMTWMSPFYSRGPIDIGARGLALPQDGSVPNLAGWRWVPTPGHSPGHVSFFRESDRTLLAGDAFCTTDQQSFLAVAQQRPELHGPPAYFTPDWEAARTSVVRLAELHPETLAPSHGLPMRGYESHEALALLAREFDRVAIPEHGRYVPASHV